MSNPLNETPCSFNQVYSIITHTKSSEYLYQNGNRGNRVGREKSREREKKSEQQINRVRDGALDWNRHGVGWKWSLVKKDTWVFQNGKSIEQIGCQSKATNLWVGLKFFCPLVLWFLFSWGYVSPQQSCKKIYDRNVIL